MLVDSVFFICAAVALLAAWRVFCTDSMIRASFLLLASFIAVGVIMLLLAAEYLGVALWFMMAVEMTVMALFMVMFMMNPAGLNPMNMVHQPRIAIAAGVAAFLILGAVAFFSDFAGTPAPADLDPVHSLGAEMLGPSMLVFESAGLVLLATMIGVVVLSSHRGRYGASSEGSMPPGLTPGGEPAGMPPKEDDDDEGGHSHAHHH
ncbi:NADH-quinone oxidoreductase subunit J [Stutzerimonas stutzeri]|uniref:NADH-quinone oxidoreductase subunit J n=1 Tax=Stutzerimonas stutzeri TaxID=316 RepID=UPI002108BA2C|nr:NADH-quinone oxidoreductase subunit J [Stutzerimonas stutzeri]MCQ4320805.1 NADH-quinone oxidoreductase subunit J [Stutzerimonas stutzeri]